VPNNFLTYKNFIPYKSITNTNTENPILFRIYRCKNCSQNTLIEFYGFDQINLFKDIHCNLCGLQKQPQKINSDLYNLEIKKLFDTIYYQEVIILKYI
jgi:DNA-directed RNA polymerase subunit RPC12/RpoP